MNKKITNRMYQLYELRDNLKEAINNVSGLLVQQNHLVEIISSSKYLDEMKDFIEGISSNNKGYEYKLSSYKERLEKVNYLIDLYEKNDKESVLTVKIITYLLEALNLTVDENTEDINSKENA